MDQMIKWPLFVISIGSISHRYLRSAIDIFCIVQMAPRKSSGSEHTVNSFWKGGRDLNENKRWKIQGKEQTVEENKRWKRIKDGRE